MFSYVMKITAAAVLATAVGACTDNKTADNATTAAPVAPTSDGEVPKATETNTAADQGTINFVEKAAMSDMFETASSKLALEKSSSAKVKEFAQMMIDAHTATSAEIKPLAASLQINPPAILDAEHQDMIDSLTKADAKDFDKMYLDQQTAAHSKTHDLMEDYADDGANPGLKTFAAATAPKVQEHMDHAKSLDKSGADGTK